MCIRDSPSDELYSLDYWALTPREYEAADALQVENLERDGRYGPYEKEYLLSLIHI